MDSKTALESRITELEIQQALQEDLLQSLSDTIARLQQTLDLQQAQLRLLYSRLQDKGQDDDASYNLSENIPPHY
ncbi:SlyX family protein [Neisseria wadsworthii]|uniref:SlyX family protein n=1 Tax=Neisseria wadsworthii TaxID=607711 RepID=UPI000D31CD75|nr:SlyX family protein [Neisseria wadsworthii]